MPEAMKPLSLQAFKLSSLPAIFLIPETRHPTPLLLKTKMDKM
jgi:hypothetical protein